LFVLKIELTFQTKQRDVLPKAVIGEWLTDNMQK